MLCTGISTDLPKMLAGSRDRKCCSCKP